MERIKDILRTSLEEIKSSSLINSDFCVPVVTSHKASLQIKASTNTFACKGTGNERVFPS